MFHSKLFAERVIGLRIEKKLVQADLAKALEVSRPTVNSWELGTRLPSVPVLYALADYFDVSVDYLLGRSGSRNTLP